MTKAADKRLHEALTDIRTMAEEMAQRSSFHVTFEDFRVMPSDEIRDWQDIVREETDDSGYMLPADLIELYTATGGFDFRWSCDADAGVVEGVIALASLPELFQRDDEQDRSMGQCLTEWRRLDSVTPDSYTAIRLDDGVAGLKCVHFKNRQPIRMNLTPRDYVIAAADHLGVIGWQTSDTDKQEQIVRNLAARE
ncbi:hypothetical protein HH800_16605 [Sphingobium yanoikuyae]|uniref:SMI1/KNR4 family protein n=1 Tax=Sphingobium yanoikuyae TaxID=13690 RepID=A0A6M4G9N8_SPHYA|nr:hypothetical protein [Sphingobium yanoikuyae]QJR03660.1 hypothetical protein HH800_16605 [Sphingobium yanoikuyae]